MTLTPAAPDEVQDPAVAGATDRADHGNPGREAPDATPPDAAPRCRCASATATPSRST